MRDKIRWSRILLEGAVIVGSILLAFGIDAWWDARGDAQRKEAVIEGLRSDFRAARVDLNRVSTYHLNGRSSAEQLMQLGDNGTVPASSSDLVDSLFSDLSGTASFDPPLGTLEALISSGELDLIGDLELALLLTGFPAMVGDLDREQRFQREALLLLYEHIDSSGLGFESFIANFRDPPWDFHSDGIYRIVHTEGFRSWVTVMWVLYGNTIANHERLDETMGQIELKLASTE